MRYDGSAGNALLSLIAFYGTANRPNGMKKNGENSMYQDTKAAREILRAQQPNGLWGLFHTLGEPKKAPLSTEQALRRLQILGYTISDEPIGRTVHFMEDCLKGKRQMPDRREKTHNWDLFTDLMLATWVRRFTLSVPAANAVAEKWAAVIGAAFSAGEYRQPDYVRAYRNVFGIEPKGPRFKDFVSFYQVSLLQNTLPPDLEEMLVDYILHHPAGIYYIYDRPVGNAYLNVLPEAFASKKASRYLGAMELLIPYRHGRSKLRFAADWLLENRDENGFWDMGGAVRDQVYFPLSDSWRKEETRIQDCSYRVRRWLAEFSAEEPADAI